MDSMRIVIASSGLGHVTRGVESWAADLAAAFSNRGLNITLCKGGGSVNEPYEHVLPCWQRGDPAVKRFLSWLPRRGVWRLGLGSPGDVEQNSFALRLIGYLRRLRADIVHVQDAQIADITRKAKRFGLIRTSTILGLGSREAPEFQQKFTYLHYLAPWYL